MNTRLLPIALLPLFACGEKPTLTRYTIDIELVGLPDWLAPGDVPYYEVPPCTTAEIFDETIRVYDGWVDGAVSAIQLRWTGFDLSKGGDNTEQWFLREGQIAQVHAALLPGTVLYEVDHKGRMLELDKDVANVRHKDSAEAEYSLGEGLPVLEIHTLAKEVEEVRTVDQGVYNCDLAQ